MSRWNLLLSVFLCLGLVPLVAAPIDIPTQLLANPDVVTEGGKKHSALQIMVVLRAPARSFFICEIRSADSRRLETSSIVIKKGDKSGVGKAFVHWRNVPLDTKIKLTAFNVQDPLNFASCFVTLKKKPMDDK